MSRFLAGALRAVTPDTPGEQPRGVGNPYQTEHE